MVGYGGAAMGSDQPRRKGRLLVFKLGGTGQPRPYPAAASAPPLDLASAEPSKGDPDKGGTNFVTYCGTCHRKGGVYLPDLSRSPAILSQDGFKAIVHDGALKDRGMAPFSHFLTAVQVETSAAFLLWQAEQTPSAATAAARPTRSRAALSALPSGDVVADERQAFLVDQRAARVPGIITPGSVEAMRSAMIEASGWPGRDGELQAA
jgi:mono/diheme cytochrome c family protein